MNTVKLFCLLFLFVFLLSSCTQSDKSQEKPSPSMDQVNTQVAESIYLTLTASAPRLTSTPQITSTPKPTETAIPSPTLIPGSYISPLSVGDTVVLVNIPNELLKDGLNPSVTKEMTLIDVKIGDEAKLLAQQNLDWINYEEPIDEQEYLAVYVRLKLLNSKENLEVETIYPFWDLTLRYSEGGDDIWSVYPAETFNQGYPPIEGEGWVFYLIREGQIPHLYFQPDLMVGEQLGVRLHGAYFNLQ